MYLINILFSLLVVGNFPFYIIYELSGIKNLFLIVYASLNILILFFRRKNLFPKLSFIDLTFGIFLLYFLIYFCINNNNFFSEYNNQFYFLILKNIFFPYITGRLLYKFLNKNIFKSMSVLFGIYLLSLVIIAILKPDSFLQKRFWGLSQTFLSDGLGFFVVTYLSFLNDVSLIKKIKKKSFIQKILFISGILMFLIIFFLGSRKLLLVSLILILLNFYNKIIFYVKIILKNPSIFFTLIFLITSLLMIAFLMVDPLNHDSKFDHLFQLTSILDIFNYKKDFCNSITNSISVRITYIYEAFKIIKENFLLGIGPGKFTIYFCDGNLTDPKAFEHPHNILLNLLSELGFIGFIFIAIPMKLLVTKLIYFSREKIFTTNFIFYSFELTFLISLISGSYYIDSFYLAIFTGSSVSLITDKKLKSNNRIHNT